ATAVPYDPIAGMIRHLCGISEADGEDRVGAKLRAVTTSIESYPTAHVPHLLHLLGLKAESIGLPSTGSPEHMRARAFQAVKELWLTVSSREPLILVVEDLHWGDPTSKTLLTSFVSDLSSARVLLLVTYRPGFLAPWGAKSYASQMALLPL